MEPNIYCLIVLSASLASLACGIIFQIYFIWQYSILDKHKNTIRGPKWKWPNGQLTEKFVSGREMSNLWREFGPVYRIWSGLTPEIVITKPEDVKKFYSSSAVEKSRSSNGGWVFDQLLGDCLGLLNGARWARLRNVFEADNFETRTARARAPDSLNCAHEHVQNLLTLARAKTPKLPLTVNVYSATVKFPFFCTARMLYGDLNDEDRDELWSLGQSRVALMRFVLRGGIYRSRLSWFLTPQMRCELDKFREGWLCFNQRMVARSFKKSSQSVICSLRESIQYHTTSKNTKEILQTLDEIIFANLDVTAHVLSWIIIMLAGSESVQQDLRKEIQENKTDRATYISSNSNLLHRCLLETLRVRPVAAFTIPEYSTETKQLGDYTIPPRVSVVIDIMSINTRNPFWGSDSERFNPRRFENIKPSDLRYNLFTFGFGARKCLGQYDAQILVKAFVIELFSICKVRLSRKDEEGSKSRIYENWIQPAEIELCLERCD